MNDNIWVIFFVGFEPVLSQKELVKKHQFHISRKN